jgi:hypothetical protein
MSSLVLGGLDVVGDETEGLTTMGAGSTAIRVPTPRWMRGATSQGVSRPHEELDYLPFDAVRFTLANQSGLYLIARPQRPMRPERLIMTAFGLLADIEGDLGNAVVINPAIYAGAVQVGAAQGSTPVAVFAPTAFGVRLSFPAVGQGTDVKIFVNLVTPITQEEEFVVVTGTLIGRAVR